MSEEIQGQSLIFRLNEHGQGPEIVRQVFLERGWQEFEEDDQAEYEWNLWWRTSRFRTSDHEQLMPWQQLNHYPKSVAITRKDSLARNLKRMKGVHGAVVFNFSPNAFNLPNDYTKFVAEYSRLRDKHPDKAQYWICKPADMSRGRGIFVFKDINELQYDCNAVVQTYISNPLLLAGYKFDLRIYVIVPSFHPLNIYIFQEGLVRFSTEKFDLGCLKNVYSHLTNTSINKYSPSYTVEKERIGPGCKWTLTQLRHYFRQSNIDDSQLFTKIQYIVILTLLIQANQVPKIANCFELYGFDIMVDENMKPWLLEVNFSPALSTDCQIDIYVKKPMINDLIDLLGFREEDKERGGAEYRQMKAEQQTMYPSYIPALGGHRSGFGQNKRGVANNQLKKRGSQHRLANLSGHGQSGSNFSLTNTPRSVSTTHVDEDNSDTTGLPAKAFSPEQKVIPLVPGCGLPSVQHPVTPGNKNAVQPSAFDSGQSSGSDEEDEKDVVNSRVNETVSSRTVYNSHPSNRDRQTRSTYTKSYNEVTGKTRMSKIQPNGSKMSGFSDSGLSSTSGSNSSDHAEHSSTTDELKGLSSCQRQQLDITVGPKKSKAIGPPQTLHRDLDEEVPYTLDKSSNIQSRFSKQTVVSKDNKTQNEHFGRTGQLRSANPNQRRKPLSFINYKNQSDLKAVSHRTASDIRYSQSLPASRSRRRQQNYEKPWRKNYTKEVPEPSAPPRRCASNPTPRVGDFFLVFPFNDTTKECAKNGLDPRVVIKETQKMLKDRLATSIEKTSAAKFSRSEITDDNMYKGNNSARSSHRSLPITLASEKSMLSTGSGTVSPSLKSSAKVKRAPHVPVVSREAKRSFSDLWSPIVLETSHEHCSNL